MNGSIETPLITVIVLTYNQCHTIRKTLDSILNQRTQYSYEVLIGEDASTDDTRKVCEEYEGRYAATVRLMPIAPNKGLLRNYRDCLAQARGKYIAGCAGDDWWHNPNKLEVQASFMERNTQYGVTYTDYDRYELVEKQVVRSYYRSMHYVPAEGDIYSTLLMRGNFIAAGTVMFRKDLFNTYCSVDRYISLGFMMEDYPTWLELSRHTLFRYIPESTFSYVYAPGSLSNPGDNLAKIERFEKGALLVRLHFLARYPVDGYSEVDLKDAFYRLMVVKSAMLGCYREARTYVGNLKRVSVKNMALRLMCYTPLIRIYANRLKGKI